MYGKIEREKLLTRKIQTLYIKVVNIKLKVTCVDFTHVCHGAKICKCNLF